METNVEQLQNKIDTLFNQGYFCSQITSIIMLENLGLGSDETIKVLSGFSGGVGRNGYSCGILNASLAMVGLAVGRGKEEKGDPRITKYIKRVYDEFSKNEYGSINCRDIVGVNWWDNEQAAKYFKDPVAVGRCQRLMINMIIFITEFLKDFRKEK